MTERSHSFLRRHRHLLILLIYPLYFWGFQYVEHAVPVAKYLMYLPADDYIPFVPVAIYPYLFWYLQIAGAIVYLGFANPKGFVQLMLFLYIGMGVSYGIYLLWPNGQNLRPALAALGEGWHYDLIRWLYSVDTPTNSNPSMHVIDSMAVYLALKRDRWLSGRRGFQVANLVLNVVIIASTVLVKQHSIIDVICGLAFSWVLYLAIMRHDLLSRALQYFREPRPAASEPETEVALAEVALEEKE
ncbi:MAG TPA: phosphatase PAP2 family protein [Opitutaceae bacterium]|nr:phosphatase PAP2 family protein [Opitutaceae bacterium]